MIDISSIDLSRFDKPGLLGFLFYPRRDSAVAPGPKNLTELSIPTERGIVIGARFYRARSSSPVILYFHGNGEIASDYDDLGDVYTRAGLSFLCADYRGYGKSSGIPTVTGMMRDCHYIFDYTKNRLKEEGINTPLIVMGRSLGSASACELAAHYAGEIDGLVIESGFARALPLLDTLGVDVESLGIKDEAGFDNIDKIRKYAGPALIIHAEHDHIIPFSDGRALFESCGSKDKVFLEIKRANHNTIFQHGFGEYMRAMAELAAKIMEKKKK